MILSTGIMDEITKLFVRKGKKILRVVKPEGVGGFIHKFMCICGQI